MKSDGAMGKTTAPFFVLITIGDIRLQLNFHSHQSEGDDNYEEQCTRIIWQYGI